MWTARVHVREATHGLTGEGRSGNMGAGKRLLGQTLEKSAVSYVGYLRCAEVSDGGGAGVGGVADGFLNLPCSGHSSIVTPTFCLSAPLPGRGPARLLCEDTLSCQWI